MIREARPVIFNGDNYSQEWHQEAEKRGLPNLRNTPDALTVLMKDKTVSLLTKFGIYTKPELRARHRILVEQYVKTLAIEGETAAHMAKAMILPAALRYAQELASGVAAMKAAGVPEPAGAATARQLNDLITQLQGQVKQLDDALDHPHPDDPDASARYMRDEVLAAMNKVRDTADLLEEIVADDLWPLPTYREMLFVR
jgi:glutamine synthetase